MPREALTTVPSAACVLALLILSSYVIGKKDNIPFFTCSFNKIPLIRVCRIKCHILISGWFASFGVLAILFSFLLIFLHEVTKVSLSSQYRDRNRSDRAASHHHPLAPSARSHCRARLLLRRLACWLYKEG